MYWPIPCMLIAFLSLASPSHATTHTVQVAPGGKLAYSPSQLIIQPGDSVVFQFPQGATHTATHGEHCVPGGEFDVKSDAMVRFDDVGRFEYFCQIGSHCNMGMKGVIVVQGGAASPNQGRASTSLATHTTTAAMSTPTTTTTTSSPVASVTVTTQVLSSPTAIPTPTPTSAAAAFRSHSLCLAWLMWIPASIAVMTACYDF